MALFATTVGHAKKLWAKTLKLKERWHHLLRWKKAQVLCIGTRREKFTSSPPCIKSFYGWRRNTPKPLCIGSYKKSMGFVDVNDMINSNSTSCNMWKWPKKLFFHLLDSTILNTFINHKSWRGDSHTYCSLYNFQGVPCYTGCTSTSFNFKIWSAIFTIGLSRVVLEDVMYVLCKERPLGDFTFVKTVM